MFVVAPHQPPPAIVSPMPERSTEGAALPTVVLDLPWQAISLKEIMGLPEVLASVANSPYTTLSAIELSSRTDTELVTQAVARMKEGLHGLTDREIKSIREGLAIVEGRSSDPFAISLARLYQVLPTEQATPELVRAPDCTALFRAKYGSVAIAPVAGAVYPPETMKLFSALQSILDLLPNQEAAQLLQSRGEWARFSELTEKTFEKEGQGMPKEIVLQARGELDQMVSDIGAKLDRLSDLQLPLSPERVLTLIYNHIKSVYRCRDYEQHYLLDGLASHTFDCDIYAKVFCEVGHRHGIPIRALYIAGLENGSKVGHCMPCLVVRSGAGNKLSIFETRSAIERLPDGAERRMYKSLDEIRERINKIADREVIGEADKPFLGSDEFILYQVRSRNLGVASNSGKASAETAPVDSSASTVSDPKRQE